MGDLLLLLGSKKEKSWGCLGRQLKKNNSNHTIKRAKTQPENYYNYILDVVSTDCSFSVSNAYALNKLMTFVLDRPEPKLHAFTCIRLLDSQTEQTAA